MIPIAHFSSLVERYSEVSVSKIDHFKERVNLEEEVGQNRAILELLISNEDIRQLSIFLDSLDPFDLQHLISHQDLDGNTPLHYALMTKASPAIVQTLVQNGANPATPNHADQTALDCILASSAPFELYPLLTSRLSPEETTKLVNRQNKQGERALDQAVIYGASEEILEFLVRAKGTISSRQPLIMLMVKKAPLPVHQLLLSTLTPSVQEDLLQEPDPRALLHYLLFNQTAIEIVEFYISIGANLSRVSLEERGRALDSAFFYKNSALLYSTILNGVDFDGRFDLLNKTKINELTSLHKAIQHQIDPKMIKVLIKASACIRVDLDSKKTPFDLARELELGEEYFSVLLSAPIVQPQPEALDQALTMAFQKSFSWKVIQKLCRKGAQFTPEAAQFFFDYLQQVDQKEQFVNLQDGKGRTLLHYLVEIKGSTPAIQWLCSHGAMMNYFSLLTSPLHWAMITKAPVEQVKAMIDPIPLEQRKACLNVADHAGCTALHLAAYYDASPEVLSLLRSYGADLLPDKEGHTPLHFTTLHPPSTIATISALLEGLTPEQRITMINYVNEANQTPLTFAVTQKTEPTVIAFLLAQGAKREIANVAGINPLHQAVLHDNIDTVKALLFGLDPEARKELLSKQFGGYTVFHLTILNSKEPVALCETLLGDMNPAQASQVVNITDPKGCTALYYVLKKKLPIDLVRLFLEAGASIDQRTQTVNGPETLLHTTTTYGGSIEVVDLLLSYIPAPEKKSFVNLTTDDGLTALHLAITYDASPDVLRLLVRNGANLDIQGGRYGHTPLHVLAMQTRPNNENFFLACLEEASPEERARVLNTTNNNKQTVLHKVAESHNPSVVIVMLLGYGAKPNLLDVNSKTPLEVAIAKKNLGAIEILMQHEAEKNLPPRQKAMQESFAAQARWQQCNTTVNEKGRVMECSHILPTGHGNALLLDTETLYPVYSNIFSANFSHLMKTSNFYHRTHFKVVNRVEMIVDEIVKIEGEIDHFSIGGHGPGENHRQPNELELDDTHALSMRNIEQVVAALKLKMKRGGIVVINSCGGGRREMEGAKNPFEYIAEQVEKIVVIAGRKNTSASRQHVNPGHFLENRFFDEGGEEEITTVFQADTRIEHYSYLEATVIENYF